MDILTPVLISGLVVSGMGVEANASIFMSAAYEQCKAKVLEKCGGDTRITMKGRKKYSGTLTVNTVVPEAESRPRLLCKVIEDALMLSDKAGMSLS